MRSLVSLASWRSGWNSVDRSSEGDAGEEAAAVCRDFRSSGPRRRSPSPSRRSGRAPGTRRGRPESSFEVPDDDCGGGAGLRRHSVSSRISEASESVLPPSPDQRFQPGLSGQPRPESSMFCADGELAQDRDRGPGPAGCRSRSVCSRVSTASCSSPSPEAAGGARPCCSMGRLPASAHGRAARSGLGGGSFYL